MEDYQTDLWNITTTDTYTVTLNDSMTVLSGNQVLDIHGFNNSAGTWGATWEVVFLNSSYVYYCTFISGNALDWGNLGCLNGIVQVVVTNTSITFVGTSSFTSNLTFGGELDMMLTIT
jgi:hypothetical protein